MSKQKRVGRDGGRQSESRPESAAELRGGGGATSYVYPLRRARRASAPSPPVHRAARPRVARVTYVDETRNRSEIGSGAESGVRADERCGGRRGGARRDRRRRAEDGRKDEGGRGPLRERVTREIPL